MNSSFYKWVLFSRYLTGEASENDRKNLDVLLQEDPEASETFSVLQQAWQLELKNSDVRKRKWDEQHIAKILQIARVEDVIEGKTASLPEVVIKKNRFSVRKNALAALILLVVGITSFAFYRDYFFRPRTTDWQMVASSGKRTLKIAFPDGSTVILNKNSSLWYNTDYGNYSREFKLTGEAYFDVAKKASCPFSVHTGNLDVQALGTSFNIKAYPEDRTIETTLLTGLVRIVQNVKEQEHNSIMLHPREKLIVDKKYHEIATVKLENQEVPKKLSNSQVNANTNKHNDASFAETSWLNGRLDFQSMSFENLAPELEKWYGIKIVFEDENVKKLSFSGSFSKESLQEAFFDLQQAAPFHYIIKNHEVEVKSLKQ